MGRSSNKGVQVVICDAKVDVYPVEHILRQIFENILGHLNVNVTLSLISIGTITDLNSCRVEWSIVILITRDKADMLKPVHASHFTYLVKAALLHIA